MNDRDSSAQAHIGDLKPDSRNARRHNPRNVAMIVDSLQRIGGARSIVIDEDDVILAGNGVVEAAAEAGIERVRIIDADGEEIIAVRRSNLTDEQKIALALYDNRTAELADWDIEQLQIFRDEGVDLSGMWAESEMADWQTVSPSGDDPGAQVDRAQELREQWHTEVGQLWEIPSLTVPGRSHRLLCGDSTKDEDVERLMGGEKAQLVYTDPPYGVAYDGGATKRDVLENDHVGTEIYGEALPHLRLAADDQAALYLWYADAHAAAAAAAGYHITAQIIWAKNHAQFVTSAHRKGKSARWYGPNNEVTLWEYNRSSSNDFHPTQKPIELATRAIGNSSASGDVVLDIFLGGAATMVAAEQTGRLCYGMEIAPKYVAVALERLAGMGLEPLLV